MINRSIEESKLSYKSFLKKHSDLNNFVAKLETAIKNTREKVKERVTQVSAEEKKIMIIEEMVHARRMNIRGLLLVRNEAIVPESTEDSYKITVNDCKKRLRVDATCDGITYSDLC